MKLGISMRNLERLSGVSRATLSRVEQNRLIPTATETARVEAVLSEAEAARVSGEPLARPS